MKTTRIEGIVIAEPIAFDNQCTFVVQTKNNQYQVISENIQALKDNVFIKTGQTVIIKGVEIIKKDSKVLFSKNSKIILKYKH
ncbi:hypothetical protein [[Clostridium] fimetarium]|uniref:Uncharacterized protein n=1 Tax=[Clostridium] fimetarium TaxID=99656 RepID=A0A1I0QW09_9FIRM|nr:hypothetical protein [[Clostridium] fimetarium]SEW31781.1 hypothetical protein SAMN05421659_109182 [[Clostridium] fimetarium]